LPQRAPARRREGAKLQTMAAFAAARAGSAGREDAKLQKLAALAAARAGSAGREDAKLQTVAALAVAHAGWALVGMTLPLRVGGVAAWAWPLAGRAAQRLA